MLLYNDEWHDLSKSLWRVSFSKMYHYVCVYLGALASTLQYLPSDAHLGGSNQHLNIKTYWPSRREQKIYIQVPHIVVLNGRVLEHK